MQKATPVKHRGAKILNMSTLADRIIEVMEAAGLDIPAAARICQVSYQAIRKLRLGESVSMDGKTLMLLARHTGFEAEWILFGTGPKHRTYATNEPQALAIQAMQKMPESEQYKIPAVVTLFTQPKRAIN